MEGAPSTPEAWVHRGWFASFRTTHPFPHPISIAVKGDVTPSSRRSSMTVTLGVWPRSMPSSRPLSAHSLNSFVASRCPMHGCHLRLSMNLFTAKGRCTPSVWKVHAQHHDHLG